MSAAADHARNADVLDDAADLIERDGLCRMGIDERGVCSGNAIYHASRQQHDLYHPAHQAFAIEAGLDPTRAPMCIFDWNDAESTTKQIVLDTMRGAAKSERTRADAPAPDDTG